jgi:hypothetical protein
MTTVTKTVFKVGDFVSWAQTGQLDLHPRFQRRPVWKSGAKSSLIDTIVRKLPIPIIFLRDRITIGSITTQREVIDGQQRLRTILSFINPTLVSDYNQDSDFFSVSKTHNSEIAGKSFDELPVSVQQAIIGYEVPVHIFSSDTEDRDVLQIFARLNATGMKLNAQELRNAEYFGIFKSFSYKIAYENLNRWQKWGVFNLASISRMLEVEEVSDLIISMHEGVHGKNQAILDRYYDKYDSKYKERPEVSRRFEAVMSAIDNSLGKKLSTIEFSRQSLFNSLFVAVYHMMYEVGSDLDDVKKPRKLPVKFASVISRLSDEIKSDNISEDLRKSLRGATAHYGTRLERVNFILEAFDNAIEES